MDEINKILEYIEIGLQDELSNLEPINEDKMEYLNECFSVSKESKIFFNEFNIVFTDEESKNRMCGLINESDLVAKVEIPEHGAYLWVYERFNNKIIETYIK